MQDVRSELFGSLPGGEAVHDQLAGVEIHGDESGRESIHEPLQIGPGFRAGFRRQEGAHTFSVAAQVRQRFDQQIPRGPCGSVRYRSHLVHDHGGTQLIGQLQGLLRGRHSPIEIIGHVIAAAGVEAHRANPQIQIFQSLPQLPQRGL